jgi:small subunit ribosomal protein S10e
MLIPKKNRKEVYKYLFQEGVLYAAKDFNLAEHPEMPEIPNLQVIKLMQSFKSKEYVTELFAWRHYYWFLTDEGVLFLREYLNLPSEIVPATQKKSTRPLERGPPRGENDRPRRFEGREGGGGYRDGGRDGGYRSERPAFGRGGGAPGGEKGDAPGGYRPEFSGGAGRGSAPPS